ncbi:hypothetical protein DPMN_088507 [Dreissena polymorpha]|uniref:Uncharacterized protein n=1 Tax=Dreissena polymorpha TaxID=45954 RepID=A0A9D4QX59_DREPO|nr:hypothetical protein DPMN_088507 [Dreissena polymorpha]
MLMLYGPQSHIRTDGHGSAGSSRIKIRDDPWTFFNFLSVDDLQRTIIPVTTRYPQGPTRTNTDSPGCNTQLTRRPYGQSRINTAEIRKAPNKHGPTRHLHVHDKNTDKHGSYTDHIRFSPDRH